ncbi:integrin binding sialoprotein [Rhinolophus ferrumequinum]|uniref:Integrin binding sialoprotein n=1 Tax=Rhinolophus ferrumequinum TaxID=59479 RepID=A0A7J7ZCJ2_RHIFE|nr:integrin binding sialoprotein [Rhinolophus ferrumequinum]
MEMVIAQRRRKRKRKRQMKKQTMKSLMKMKMKNLRLRTPPFLLRHLAMEKRTRLKQGL